MFVSVDMLVFNPSGDFGEDTAKMEAQIARIDPQNSGTSKADVPNAGVSA
jgi:hypothetical protein